MNAERDEKWLFAMVAGFSLVGLGLMVLSAALVRSAPEMKAEAAPVAVDTQHKAQYLSAAFEAYELRLLASFESGSYPASVDESRERLVDALGTFCTP